MNKKRFAALITAVLFVFAMVSSVCFIAASSDHECIGDGCIICGQIEICGKALRTVFSPAAIYAFALFGCCVLFAVSLCYNIFSRSLTLVSLKIKLSD